ncbi:uncharacterized protein LOC108605595 [Drosophila busckii]|uniref:uncharacterized protein LOC108605595 n=1 Tax=Drosophila busckii TaxID=30019 RepID=UPI00083F0012|nr:uncharacterized protein LOC108605595 [Drosophila busckii]
MKADCKYNLKAKRCSKWFNNVCSACRARFHRRHAKDALQQDRLKLLTAEECYAAMKRDSDGAGEPDADEEIWWKVPVILLIIASILAILMLICLLCQRFVKELPQLLPQHVDFAVCATNENQQPKPAKSSIASADNKNKPKRKRCCSFMSKSKSNIVSSSSYVRDDSYLR